MALALASALPSRCSLSTCTRRCDSPGVPLLKFNSPSRFVPETLVPRLSAQDSSLGFFPLQRLRMRESTSPPGKPPTSPKTRKQSISWSSSIQSEDQTKPAGRSPTACFGAAPRLSQPLSDLFLSLPCHRFQAANVHGVVPSRDLVRSQSLQQLVATGIPSCRFSIRLRCPGPSPRTPSGARSDLGWSGTVPFTDYRVFVLAKSSHTANPIREPSI
jgi:hypothetical protein